MLACSRIRRVPWLVLCHRKPAAGSLWLLWGSLPETMEHKITETCMQDSRRAQAEAERHIRETEEVVQVLRVSTQVCRSRIACVLRPEPGLGA